MKKLLSIVCVLVLTLGVFFSVIPVSYAETHVADSGNTHGGAGATIPAGTSHEAMSNEFYNDSQHIGEDVCSEPAVKKVLRLIGVVILILRFSVPFIIIAKGTFLFYNAIIKDGADQLGKSAKEFGSKILLGIIVFFIPTLIKAALDLYSGFSNVESDYVTCSTCLLDPVNCS